MKDNKNQNPNAEVIAVFPNKVIIAVDDLNSFVSVDAQVEKLRVGSYLEVSDNDNHKLIVVIDNYSIVIQDNGDRKYIYELWPWCLHVELFAWRHHRKS